MRWWAWIAVVVVCGWALAAIVGVTLIGAVWRTVATRREVVPPVTPRHHLQPGEQLLLLESRPGLATHRRDRWVTPRVAAAMGHAADVAHAAGGVLHVGHASREGGGPFPPHLSHRDGRDVDVGYTGQGYPSPPGATPPAWWVAAVQAAGVREVFVRSELVGPLRAAGVNARAWPGHATHAHWRFA